MIAALVPLALAFAIDPQWTKLLEVVALFVTLEMTITNAVEPRLYGSSTGLSALAVLVAAMFWATVWGPIGLILATPITVCLVVLGRYVPQLEFLETLLGSEPVLAEEEQFYQRLVSGNTEEAIELAEASVEQSGSPRAFYDEVAVPALRLAERDRTRDDSDAAGRRLVAEGMDAVVGELEDLWPDEPSLPLRKQAVLCIGGRTELDGAAAGIVAQTISRDGITASVLPPVSLRPQGIGQIALEGIDTMCIAYLGGKSATYLRFAVRRLRRRAPKLRIVACLLSADPETAGTTPPGLEMLTVVKSIQAAESAILSFSAIEGAAAAEAEELSTVEKLRHRVRPGASLNEFTSRVANAFDAPISVLSVAESNEDGAVVEPRQNELATLRDYVMRNEGPVAVDIATAEPELVENTFLVENGFGFFAGAPIRLEGHNYGALLVFNKFGAHLTDQQLAELQDFADEFVTSWQAELQVVAA